MAPMGLRRAIGLVKDRTSISIAKAARKADGSLEALVVMATSHDAVAAPAEDHLQQIVARTWSSRPRAYSCVNSISKRLQRTRDWAVALKALILVHRLAVEGGTAIKEEIAFAGGGRFGGLLDLPGFKDESHSDSWDYTEFVRSYAAYLGEKVRVMAAEEEELKENAETVFDQVKRLQVLLDRVVKCRPAGVARFNRIVIAALYLVVVDSFEIYGDLCERLSSILDGFPELGFESSAVALELYVKAARQVDRLFEYYGSCRDVGVGNSVGYPEVNRISDDLLKSLEEFLKAKLSSSSGVEEKAEVSLSSEVDEKAEVSNPSGVVKESIWMLPPPPALEDEVVTGDLIDLNEMPLSVFSGSESDHRPSEEGTLVQSGGTEAGRGGGEDWELALVVSARHIARQREELSGGLEDPFMGEELSGGLEDPFMGEELSGGLEDPFTASLAVPPPTYVQMADMEKKQTLLVQERQLWRQYDQTNNIGQPRAFHYYS